MNQRALKIFFDGGCRPNPGPIEVAVVARGEVRFFDDLGEGGSEEAEWLALCLALKVAQEIGVERFDLLGDSRSVIEQASRVVACRGVDAGRYLERFRAAATLLAPRRLRWVPRTQNLAGIALDRQRARGGVLGLTR